VSGASAGGGLGITLDERAMGRFVVESAGVG
jgi:anti-sigma regulatory factor (Ser/Thr protein kinase)